MKVRTRFSPSPTGIVHLGSTYQILIDYAFAKRNKGKFIVRIEDTDQNRYVAGAEEKVYEALKWLNITPDESPIHGGKFGPYRQSERLTLYKKYAEELIEKGFAYYCFCAEERLKKARESCLKEKKPPKYDRLCCQLSLAEAKKRIAGGEKAAIRMKIPDNEKIKVYDLVRGEIIFDSNLLDDQIILKSDSFPTYHLAVVVDDHLMEITHTVRGQEWLPSAPKHFLLYRYFGWQPPQIFHTPVILDPAGGKLSKRKGHNSLFWFKENGFLSEALLNFLALLGWSHPKEKEVFSLDEFISLFDLKDMSAVAPVFDLTKLEWMNGEYIRAKSNSELVELLKPFLPELNEKQLMIAAPLIKERIKTLKEARELLEFVWTCPDCPRELLLSKVKDCEIAKEMLIVAKEIIEKFGIDETKKLQEEMLKIIKEKGWNTGCFFMVLRVAVCAKTITPPILESLPLIRKEETLARIEKAIKKLS